MKVVPCLKKIKRFLAYFVPQVRLIDLLVLDLNESPLTTEELFLILLILTLTMG